MLKRIFPVLFLSACVGMGSSAGTTALTIVAADSTVGLNSVVAMTASGGTEPYDYFVQSGSGAIDSTTGSFTSPGTNQTVKLGVEDADGALAYVTVTVSSSYASSTSTSTTPVFADSTATMLVGSSYELSVSGGTTPYTFAVVTGDGSLDDSLFTAGTTAGTVKLRVTDSNGATDAMTVTVVAKTVLSATSKVWVDTQAGFVFDNHATGVDGAEEPQLVFFGTGEDNGVASLAERGDTCKGGSGIELLAPCAIKIPLRNLVPDTTLTSVYKATVEIAGRGKTVSFELCVRPGEPDRAYIKWAQSNRLGYRDLAYSTDAGTLLEGRSLHAAYNTVDTKSKAGYAAITIKSAAYSSSTTCGSGYTASNYVEASSN